MKLRLYGNSLRFRLSPVDVGALDKTGIIRNTTRFAPDVEFMCCIRLSTDINRPQATLESNRITIDLPAAMGRDWARSDTVGIRQAQDIDGRQSLDILIEKDFECLEPGAAESGKTLYPNPNKTCT